MVFYVIGEPQYETSNWYKSILDGLMGEKRQKRLTLVPLKSAAGLKTCRANADDVIFIIGTNSSWIDAVASECEARFGNRVIVLGNHKKSSGDKKYSTVTADIAHDIRLLYSYLKSCGREKIAMYGINPESASDTLKKESFLSCGASENDLFENNETLRICFERFAAVSERYDAVICVNTYAAISLMRHIENKRKLFVTSCSGTTLANIFSPSITHTVADYSAFGKAGFDLAHILRKNKSISSVTITLSGKFVPGETTDNIPLKADNPAYNSRAEKADDKFYSDAEIDEMIRTEAIINSCSDEDLLIVKEVLSGATYADIAAKHYVSENGVKYKVKNMFEICRVKSKAEFIRLLCKYITQ